VSTELSLKKPAKASLANLSLFKLMCPPKKLLTSKRKKGKGRGEKGAGYSVAACGDKLSF